MLHHILVFKSDLFFKAQTAKGLYNVADLTEVKIPINMPNIADWKGYENISGQINFGDVSYNYVKMRMTRTAMYLMCVPNYETTCLSGQNIIDAKPVKHMPVSQKEHVPFGKTALIDHFSFAFVQFRFNAPLQAGQKRTVLPVQKPVFSQREIPEQPPRLTC